MCFSRQQCSASPPIVGDVPAPPSPHVVLVLAPFKPLPAWRTPPHAPCRPLLPPSHRQPPLPNAQREHISASSKPARCPSLVALSHSFAQGHIRAELKPSAAPFSPLSPYSNSTVPHSSIAHAHTLHSSLRS